jgi:hypothetical protein
MPAGTKRRIRLKATHARQDGVCHAQHAKQIGFELLSRFLNTGFFQSTDE